MALHTWVARFVVDHGRVTEEGGRLRSFQRRRLDEPDVDLHVLHEPGGGRGEDLGSQSLDNIGKLFLADRLSLTGGLARALRETHTTLLDWNRRSLPRDQVSIGVTAALVAGNVAYLAQAGPSLLFWLHGGKLRRLEPDEQGAGPLGEGEVEPSLRRIELAAGDLVLAASETLETILDEQALGELLARGTEEALPELYLLTRDLPNFALFAISCAETDAAESPAGEEQEAPGAIEAPEPEPLPVTGARTARVPREAPEQLGGPQAGSVGTMPRPIDISRPVVRLRGEGSIGRGEYARTTGESPKFSINLGDWRLIQIGAVVAVLLLLVAFVPGLVRQNRGEKLSQLVNSAITSYQASQAATAPADKRFQLEETRRLTTEALRIDETNATALQLRDQATSELQAMDAVVSLDPMTTVTTLGSQLTGDISIEGLVVHAGQAFMVDTKGGRVIQVPVDGSAQAKVVYQDGQTYGNAPAKSPQFVTWDGDANGGRLLILDAERKLFELPQGSTQPSPLPLRKTNTWTTVDGIAAYDGNFYVLDAGGSQVHRYLPAAQGFDSEPASLLTRETNLAQSVGFVVDGDIFVIYKDGKAGRFSNGLPADFSLGGIDRPIGAAIDIAVATQPGEVYIADSGNKRIVVAGKDGTFHRQYVSNGFTDLRAIAVDPDGGHLYVVVGDALLSAPVGQ
jgi:hypothetical protein